MPKRALHNIDAETEVKGGSRVEKTSVWYRALIENLPQKIFLKDKRLVYVSCNENMARDFKIKANDIAGKTDYDFFPRELSDKYRTDDKRIMDSGETEEIEESYLQDGHLSYVHTVKTPVKDAAGRVVGILGIFWDITAHKNMEKELDQYRQSLEGQVKERTAELHKRYKELRHEISKRKNFENLFAAILTSSPIGMYIVQNNKFLLCSPEFEKGIGYNKGELIGRRSLDIVIQEDRNLAREKAIERP